MPEPWMPGLVHDPGAAAGYKLTYDQRDGHNLMECAKLHYTAGYRGGDYPIGLKGYFQFYVLKDGTPVQFAEADAYCMDSGNWNKYGPGIEFERLNDSEPLTDHQIEWGGKIIRWLSSSYGIPLTFYDTGGDNAKRVDPPFEGFITHRSLRQPGHVDYISQDDWDRMVAVPKEEEDNDMQILHSVDQDRWFLHDRGVFPLDADQRDAVLATNLPVRDILQVQIDRIGSVYPAAPAGSGDGKVTLEVRVV